MKDAIFHMPGRQRPHGGDICRSILPACAAVLFFLAAAAAPVFAAAFPGQGIYEFRSAVDEGYTADVKHCLTDPTDYGTLQLYRPLQVKQQEFYLEAVSSHSCRIVSLESGQYLTETQLSGTEGLPAGENASGEVRMADRAETPAPGTAPVRAREKDHQLWSLVAREDGTYLIASASGLYLTLQGGRACNGAELKLEPFSGGRNQRWRFAEAPVYPAATAETDAVNPYLEDGPLESVQVRIRFQDTTEILTSATIVSWMDQDDAHSASLNEEKLRAWVQHLGEKYNTVGRARTFVTSYKTPITLTHGNFGWKLDEEATVQLLKRAAARPGTRTVYPKWTQRGGDFYGTNTDIGDSYVEIDLNAQKVWLYRDGEQLLETDCVSGTKGTERETPGGVYFVFYKQAPAVLHGADYASPVSYWMPFNGNIGMHDAPWRSAFGGEIYKTDGSHGCVNLPYDAAEKIYQTVSIGYPVVCYH